MSLVIPNVNSPTPGLAKASTMGAMGAARKKPAGGAMGISGRLRSLRVEKDLRQEDLAEHAGVDQSTISSWESGRRSADHELYVHALVTIARKLDADPMWLLLGESENPPLAGPDANAAKAAAFARACGYSAEAIEQVTGSDAARNLDARRLLDQIEDADHALRVGTIVRRRR